MVYCWRCSCDVTGDLSQVEQLKVFAHRANLEREECLEREKASARDRAGGGGSGGGGGGYGDRENDADALYSWQGSTKVCVEIAHC